MFVLRFHVLNCGNKMFCNIIYIVMKHSSATPLFRTMWMTPPVSGRWTIAAQFPPTMTRHFGCRKFSVSIAEVPAPPEVEWMVWSHRPMNLCRPHRPRRPAASIRWPFPSVRARRTFRLHERIKMWCWQWVRLVQKWPRCRRNSITPRLIHHSMIVYGL